LPANGLTTRCLKLWISYFSYLCFYFSLLLRIF